MACVMEGSVEVEDDSHVIAVSAAAKQADAMKRNAHSPTRHGEGKTPVAALAAFKKIGYGESEWSAPRELLHAMHTASGCNAYIAAGAPFWCMGDFKKC